MVTCPRVVGIYHRTVELTSKAATAHEAFAACSLFAAYLVADQSALYARARLSPAGSARSADPAVSERDGVVGLQASRREQQGRSVTSPSIATLVITNARCKPAVASTNVNYIALKSYRRVNPKAAWWRLRRTAREHTDGVVMPTINHKETVRIAKHTFTSAALAGTIAATVFTGSAALTTVRAADITPTEARTIAKEAYIYGFPLVDNYRIQYGYFVDRQNPEFKAPWNQIVNIPRVYTPADTAIQTPNSDTPYSFVGMDLRAEPMVLTVPPIEKKRYFSIQLIDAYTFNFDYIGSRATGNEGGSYMIAGPNWKGETPKGVKKVFRAETEFVFAVYRTQLFKPDDIDNVKKVQAGYKAQTLSAFLGQPAPKAAPAIDFIKPLSPAEEKTSPEFFNILNFVLQFCPTDPSETELMARFAKIGVGAGKTFDASKLSPKTAIEQGIGDAWADFAGLGKLFDEGKVTSGDVFGTRQFLKNNYLYRMAAAVMGIYGNSKAEAMYPVYGVDSDGKKLDGANRYTLRFAPGQLPPVHAFWSLTMYELPKSLLVANPINRYLINSPMLPELKKDADGGLTLLVQNESPGKDKESNWLPAPKGPFIMYMRLYWPKEEATEGKWTAPKLTQAK